MKYGNFDQSYIVQYLQSLSELDSFYVFCVNGSEPGLIHYLDSDGESWSLMEDDNELVDACLEYLMEMGAPIFDDVDKLKAFESERTSAK